MFPSPPSKTPHNQVTVPWGKERTYVLQGLLDTVFKVVVILWDQIISGVLVKVYLTVFHWVHDSLGGHFPSLSEYIVKMFIFNSYQNLRIDSLAGGARIIVVGKARWISLKQTKLIIKKKFSNPVVN